MGREIYRKYHNVINYFVGLAAILCAMIGMGILYNLVIPGFNMLAAIIGKEAFLEPETVTSPANLLPPSIM